MIDGINRSIPAHDLDIEIVAASSDIVYKHLGKVFGFSQQLDRTPTYCLAEIRETYY